MSLKIISAAALSVMLVISSVTSSMLLLSPIQSTNAYADTATAAAPCIAYDASNKLITITCDSATITDIANQLKNPNILHKETPSSGSRIWLLNAGIEIAKGAILYINSTDTKWLKIIPNEINANEIQVSGS